jgi:cell division initiation protein
VSYNQALGIKKMATDTELDHKKIRKVFRGYDPAEVDEMFRAAAAALETVLAENAELREEVETHAAEVEMHRREDRFVHEALVTAQRTADEIRLAAQVQADSLVESARQSANLESSLVKKRVQDLSQEIERLRSERKKFVDDFRLLLEKHQRELNFLYLNPPSESLSA